MNKHKDPEQLQGVAALSLIKQSIPFRVEGCRVGQWTFVKVRDRGYEQCEVKTEW